MGMSSGKGGGRTTMAEINVTPMVDVMLVLLIIFMVTAPLIQQGVKVNLPTTKAQAVESADKKIVLSIDVTKKVFIGEVEIPFAELEEKLKSNAKLQAEKELYLHADRDLPYGIVVDVMAMAQRAGVTNAQAAEVLDATLALISEALQKGEEVRLLGFGSFVVAERAASSGRNPSTGETIEIKASKQARFKPGKSLKDSLNA